MVEEEKILAKLLADGMDAPLCLTTSICSESVVGTYVRSAQEKKVWAYRAGNEHGRVDVADDEAVEVLVVASVQQGFVQDVHLVMIIKGSDGSGKETKGKVKECESDGDANINISP